MPRNYKPATQQECNGEIGFNLTEKCIKQDTDVCIQEKSHVVIRARSSRKRWTNKEKYLSALCLLLFCACVAFVIVAFVRDAARQGSSSKYCLTRHCIQTAASLMDAMDAAVDPCEDFFMYACGSWIKKNIIPADKSSFNTFEKLHDDLQVILKRFLEVPPTNSDTKAMVTAKTLHRSCMNTTQIEFLSDKLMRSVLQELGGWPVMTADWDPDAFHVAPLLGRIRGDLNTPILIESWVGADDKNSSVNIIQLDQAPQGMPSRDYYLMESRQNYLEAYMRYMKDVARLLGASEDNIIQMDDVRQFEIEIAKVTKQQSDRHDTGALYLKITVKELMQQMPGFDWLKYFNAFMPVEITEEEKIVTVANDYMQKMVNIIQKTDKRTVANYIIWRVILERIPDLTYSYQQLKNNYRKVLQGVSRDKVRWQKCVEYVNEKMGMAVGAMFIHENFKRESKETVDQKESAQLSHICTVKITPPDDRKQQHMHNALEMIHNIREAFNELLHENIWMDADTRAVAWEKASAMNERIGYPEYITNNRELDKKYASLSFKDAEFFQNVLKLEKFHAGEIMAKLRQPINKERWEQGPAVVNAFYNPNTNDIVFPAGILQPLFYSRHFPKSLNYGGIGVVIGHEITHGFDDEGRQYDKNGNLKQWWKNDTVTAFRKQAQCMIDQYSGYTLSQIGLNIDGKNTQGENIADNGGLKQSFRAYRKWVEKNGEELPLPGVGLNHNQLFFLNYAQIWCGSLRDEEAIHKIATSVHSPGSIRVLGPLSNSIDFAEAYNCPLGSRMNPVHKCSVW